MKNQFKLSGLSAALLLAGISQPALSLTPADSLFAKQWAMNYTGGQVCAVDEAKYPGCLVDGISRYISGVADSDINATQGWDYFVPGSQQVVVALLDTGIDTQHPDLKPYLWKNPAETRPDGSCVADGVDNDNNGYKDDCYGWDPKNYVGANGEDVNGKGITDGVIQANGSLNKAMNDPVGHGTQMAGTILAGANGAGVVGVAGVASNVKIVTCAAWKAEKVGDVSSLPSNLLAKPYIEAGLPADQVECANYFATLKNKGVNIVVANVSGGVSENFKITPTLAGLTNSNYLANTPEVIAALEQLKQLGILVVASTGNYAWDLDNQIDAIYPVDKKAYYPASFDMDNILTVSATNISQQWGGLASWGRYSADVAAPGEDALTTASTSFIDSNNGGVEVTPATADFYVPSSGTSPAAAYVTGLAALIKANSATANLTAAQLKRLIMSSGKKAPALTYTTASGNLIRVDSALNCSAKKLKRRNFPKTDTVTVSQGGQLVMEVLNYNCAASNGDASIAVKDLLTNSVKFYLYDNGTSGDKVAGDGIYTGTWTVPSSTTTYKLSYGTDSVTAKADALYVNPKTTFIDASLTGLVGSTGSWTVSSLNPLTEHVPYRGAGYYASGSANASYKFKFNAPVAGSYTIYANWPINKTAAEKTTPEVSNIAVYDISTTAGVQSVTKNQRTEGGAWIELGTYTLSAGNNTVTVKQGTGASGILVADTIRVERNTN